MTSSTPNNPRYSRRIKWLGIGVALAAIAYTGFWFWAASYLKHEISKGLQQANTAESQVECANLDVKGYPFRAGVFCDKVAFTDSGQNFSVSFGALRTAAQIYDPAKGILELDGPMEMQLPTGETVKGNWTLLHASARYGNPLPSRADFELKDFELSVAQLGASPLAKAELAEVHFRTVEKDVDLAASSENLSLATAVTGGRTVPPFDFQSSIRINDGAKFLETSATTLGQFLRGQSGVINAIGLSFVGGGGVSISGPLAVDEAGLLSGDLSVVFSEAEKLGQTVQNISPDLAAYLTPSLSAAASSAKPGENPKIDVTIRRGKAAIGIFPLGEIPALN